MAKSSQKWGKIRKVGKSKEKWGKVVESGKSGEKWRKVAKVGKSGEKWRIVANSGEKCLKVVKSGETVGKQWEKVGLRMGLDPRPHEY